MLVLFFRPLADPPAGGNVLVLSCFNECMKIILLEDVKGVGTKFDIKEVATGYAKNFLIPRGLAKAADKSSLADIELMREAEAKKKAKAVSEMQEVAKKLEGKAFEMAMKTAEDGTLYGSISASQIATMLKKEGFKVSKEQVALDKPIKGIGEFDILVKLNADVEAKVKITVKGEEK